MKKILLIAIMPFVLFGCKTILTQKNCPTINNQTMSSNDFDHMIMNYFKEKDTKKIVPFINTLNPNQFSNISAKQNITWFLSEIFKENESNLETIIIEEMCGLNENDHKKWDIVTTSLWLSNTDKANTILQKIKTNAHPNGKKFIKELQQRNPSKINPILTDNPTPNVIDALWAKFFASGNPKYIHKIIEFSFSTDSVPTKKMIHWSLKSNARNFKEIEIIKTNYLNQLKNNLTTN